MLTEEEIATIREKILTSERPLFFFDDDIDGTASFVILYKITGKGKGICVKGKPIVEEKYAKKVEEYDPDRIFVLDKPLLEQAFIDKALEGRDIEIIWLDHHPIQLNKHVQYYNPRKNIKEGDPVVPTSYMAYQIAKKYVEDTLWIAAIGTTGDWSTALLDETKKQYPDLMPENITKPDEALFATKLGELSRIINFNLKGPTTDVMKSIKTLTRIESPYEILDQTTPRGRFLFRKAQQITEKYLNLKKKIKTTDDKFIVFKYEDSKLALSSELSNEVLFEHPDKIIIICREKTNEIVMSIRSGTVKIVDKLKKALDGVEGYGGGHDMACGACMKKSDFPKFMEQFKHEFE
jgi:single-stranded DNA-specific DHH superfamily exonuclease